jgi:hypothetical protein
MQQKARSFWVQLLTEAGAAGVPANDPGNAQHQDIVPHHRQIIRGPGGPVRQAGNQQAP